MHTRKRQDDTCEMLHATMGDSFISCEIQLAKDFQQWCSSLPACVIEELFSPELPNIKDCSQGSNTELEKLKSPSITIDNKLSSSHTLLQIHCLDQRGLFYDILRTMKDCNIRVI